jgi:uncharacterized protein (TIGR03032 family)
MEQVNSPPRTQIDGEERSASEPKLEFLPSRQFPEWLAEQRVSLAFTTYQAGKLFLIGLQANGRLSLFERTFNRCMGFAGNGQTLWMSTLYQLWRFENTLAQGEQHDDYDCMYAGRPAAVANTSSPPPAAAST